MKTFVGIITLTISMAALAEGNCPVDDKEYEKCRTVEGTLRYAFREPNYFIFVKGEEDNYFSYPIKKELMTNSVRNILDAMNSYETSIEGEFKYCPGKNGNSGCIDNASISKADMRKINCNVESSGEDEECFRYYNEQLNKKLLEKENIAVNRIHSEDSKKEFYEIKKAWQQYSGKDCSFISSNYDQTYHWVLYNSCMNNHIESRIKQLDEIEKCDGDICL